MMKSFVRLTNVDPGFNAEHLLVFNAGLATSADATRQTSFYQRGGRAKRSGLPGVQSVGAVSRLPLAGGNSSRSFSVLGDQQSHEADHPREHAGLFSDDGYFVACRDGTLANTTDRASLPVAIINQATAARCFPGRTRLANI